MATIGNVSGLDDVGLLVRLNSANSSTQAPEDIDTLTTEAKRRGLLVSVQVTPNTPIGRQEFRLRPLPYESLERILALVTRADSMNNMGLHEEVLKECEIRTSSQPEIGDTIFLSNGKSARIFMVDNGVAFYGKGPNEMVPIVNLGLSPKHGRGCWVVNLKG